MKGLRKYISPFSPDQSGTASVLFGYGGMLIIMDAHAAAGIHDNQHPDRKSVV